MNKINMYELDLTILLYISGSEQKIMHVHFKIFFVNIEH